MILAQAVHYLFFIYLLMILLRIFSSWLPEIQRLPFMPFVVHYTEPYLGFFRGIIPPIGGVLDLSPMLALFALHFLEKLVLLVLFL
ncbi:Uncharacterized membrane protein YlmG [Chlamydiales bacterium SCGC AG-110-M15]|nr:Uncharacterized membrane protein YlmG [Chlamydiales bacterium SCGC AG-110-M15]